MKLLKISSWFGKEKSSDDGTVWTSFGNDSSNATTVNRQTLMENDKNWVFVCVNKISGSVSSIGLRLMKVKPDGKDEEIFNHAILSALYKPNSQMSGREFRYVTSAHLELTGSAFWLKKIIGKKLELFPLNPKYMKTILSDDGMSVIRYEYQVGTKRIIYQLEQIYHLRYPNPNSPLIGRGTLEGIAEWVDVDNYATEFNRRFFINGAKMGGMIETDSADEGSRQRLRVSVEEMHKGAKNAHKIGILPKGAKFVESAMTPKDMEFSEADNRFRDKILSAFGVPKSVLGISEIGTSRADAEAKNYVFQAFTIKPKIEHFVAFLNEFVLPEFDTTGNFYFSFHDPVPENQEIIIKENQAGLGNAPYLTLNEVRARMGLPSVSGGDSIYGNPFLAPIGTVEESQKSITPKRVVKEDVADTIATKAIDAVFSIKKEEMTKEQVWESKHKEFIARVSEYEKVFAKRILAHDTKQKQEVMNNLERAAKAVKKEDLLDKDKAVTALIDIATPLMAGLMTDEGTKQLIELGLQQAFDANAKRVKDKLAKSVKKMAESYTDTTLELLTNQINAGIQAGEGINEIAKRISQVYDLSEEYRAVRTARTEVFSTANDASREAFVQSGVVETVRWHTAEDEKTCEFCNPLDGTVVGVKESFFGKGEEVEGEDGGTYDTSYEKIENPPLHPNCRCFILPEKTTLKASSEDIMDELISLLTTKDEK